MRDVNDDVTIPVDVAYRMALFFRDVDGASDAEQRKWADLLDPKPPTLRERVAEVVRANFGFTSDALGNYHPCADAVLAVVADWLEAQPLCQRAGAANGRAHDVRLLRGEQS